MSFTPEEDLAAIWSRSPLLPGSAWELAIELAVHFGERATGTTESTGCIPNHRELQLALDFMPVAFSQNGLFQGDVAFVGYGISAPELGYDDYQAVDVKEKFVFVLRHGPEGDDVHSKFGKYHALRYKALTAREKGAKGIVYIDDGEDFSKSSLSRLRYDNSFADSGIAAFAMSKQTAREIFSSPERIWMPCKSRSAARKRIPPPSLLLKWIFSATYQGDSVDRQRRGIPGGQRPFFEARADHRRRAL